MIHRSYPDIKLTTYRPCDCPDCLAADDPEMYAVADLKRFAEAGQPIQCRRSMDLVDPGDLLATLVPEPRAPRPGPEQPAVFVSYNWGGPADAVADEIVATLRARGVHVERDRDAMHYRDSIRTFMRRLGAATAVVAVVDRAYLESPHCMFELSEVASDPSRVFPVVLPDAQLADPLTRLGYVRFWDAKRAELDRAMREGNQDHLQGIREDLDLYVTIGATVARITDVLRDMNTLTLDAHRAADFAQLYDALAVVAGGSAGLSDLGCNWSDTPSAARREEQS